MKVLMLNGSWNNDGSTKAGLEEMAKTFAAEGVETEETLEFLKQFGKLAVQGFWFDRPMLPEEFERKYCAR